MAEVVGVVAAAAQLTTVCLSLLDATKKIKSAPATLRRYQVQLEDIQHISLHITQNPLLQTLEVESQTRSILGLVEESSLPLFTGKSRLSQNWTLIRQERTLLESFNTLERHKTSLLLVIDSIQASALHRIHLDINTMAEKKPTSPSLGSPSSSKPQDYTMASNDSMVLPNAGAVPGTEPTAQHPNAAQDPAFWFNTAHSSAQYTIRSFGSFTGHGSDSINGHVVEVDPGDEARFAGMTFPHPVIATNTVKIGSGVLLDGILVESSDKLGSFAMPGANVTTFGSKQYSRPGNSDEEVMGGMRITGTYSRIRPKRFGTARADGKK